MASNDLDLSLSVAMEMFCAVIDGSFIFPVLFFFAISGSCSSGPSVRLRENFPVMLPVGTGMISGS